MPLRRSTTRTRGFLRAGASPRIKMARGHMNKNKRELSETKRGARRERGADQADVLPMAATDPTKRAPAQKRPHRRGRPPHVMMTAATSPETSGLAAATLSTWSITRPARPGLHEMDVPVSGRSGSTILKCHTEVHFFLCTWLRDPSELVLPRDWLHFLSVCLSVGRSVGLWAVYQWVLPQPWRFSVRTPRRFAPGLPGLADENTPPFPSDTNHNTPAIFWAKIGVNPFLIFHFLLHFY